MVGHQAIVIWSLRTAPLVAGDQVQEEAFLDIVSKNRFRGYDRG
jgi:hypothetical protein